jgi:hypothetical protein
LCHGEENPLSNIEGFNLDQEMKMFFRHKGGNQSTPKKCEEESFVDKIQLIMKGKKGPAPKKQKGVECFKELREKE